MKLFSDMGYKPASEIKASGGSQPRKEEGASHPARRGKNAKAFLNPHRAILVIIIMRYARKEKLFSDSEAFVKKDKKRAAAS